jgi:hypothetical protein
VSVSLWVAVLIEFAFVVEYSWKPRIISPVCFDADGIARHVSASKEFIDRIIFAARVPAPPTHTLNFCPDLKRALRSGLCSLRHRRACFSASVSIMPRNGAIMFNDLVNRLDALRVTCERCGRNGRYRLESLIAERGPDANVPDWLHKLTVTCEIKQAQNWRDRCATHCPDLPKVL